VKRLKKLRLELFDFIKCSFFNNDIEIDEVELNLFNSILYSYDSGRVYDDFSKVEYNLIKKNLQKFEEFIYKYNSDSFQNINDFSYYYDLIVSKYIDVMIDNGLNIYDINNKKVLDIILKSSQYSFESLYYGKKVKDSLRQKFEKAILNNVFWSYLYTLKVLKKPWKELENLKSFKDQEEVVKVYISEILLKNVLFKEDTNPSEFFIKYFNHPIIKRIFIDYLLQLKILVIIETFKCAHIPELEDFLFIKRKNDYVNFYVRLVFQNNLLEPVNPNKYTEDVNIIIKRFKKRIMDDPQAIVMFLKNENINHYNAVEENLDHFKKIMLKNEDSLIDFLKDYYLEKHKKIVSEFPEAIKTILDSKNPEICFKYIKDVIYRNRDNIDENELKDFIDIIATSAETSFKYAKLIMKRFKKGEKIIYTDSYIKQIYLSFLKDIGIKIKSNNVDIDF
jgi:hypothetical protein